MSSPFLFWPVWFGELALESALLWQLLRTPLFRTYRLFTFLIAFQVVRECSCMAIYGLGSRGAYGTAYWFSEMGFWVLMFLFILELYEESLRHYAGIRKLFEIVVAVAAGIVLGIIAVSAVSRAAVFADPQQWLNQSLYAAQRYVRLTHATLLVVLLAFLDIFRIRVSPLLHVLILGWLLSSTTQVVAGAVRSQMGPVADPAIGIVTPLVYSGVIAACLWAVYESGRQKEFLPVRLRFAPADGERLIRQLEGLNARLAKALRS